MYKSELSNKIQKVKRNDIFSKKKRSEVMSKIKNKQSKIEISVGKFLWSKGFRYRKNKNSLFGKPDFSNQKKKIVIFIDSCFWHGCEKHFKIPKTNRVFWERKINRNRQRDQEVSNHYKKLHWQSIRLWEHDLSNKDKAFKKIL